MTELQRFGMKQSERSSLG